MTSWQRRRRLVAIVVAISVAGAAYWASGARRTAAPPPKVTPLEPTVTAQMRGGEAAQSSGAQEDFSVDFKEQKTYQDGRTVATGLDRHASPIAAARASSSPATRARWAIEQASIAMSGDVVLKASDGLVATAGSATYSNGEGIVRAPGPVTFTQRRHQGRRHRLHLRLAARHDVAARPGRRCTSPARPTSGAIDATAGAFGEARRDRYMRIERGTKLVRPGQTIEADEAMVYLFPDRDDPDRIELRGNARITGGEGMGALRAMQARDINLDYGEDGRTVEHATLAGQSSVTLAGTAPGAAGQRLTAEFIDIALGPDGAVTSLSSRERVRGDAAGDADARRPAPSESVELGAAGAAGAGPDLDEFDQQVEFREGATGKTPPARIAPRPHAHVGPRRGRRARSRHLLGRRAVRERHDARHRRRGPLPGHRRPAGAERPRRQRPRRASPTPVSTIEGDAITVGLRGQHDGRQGRGFQRACSRPARARATGRDAPGAARRRPGGVRQRRGARLRQRPAPRHLHRPGAAVAGRHDHSRRAHRRSTRRAATSRRAAGCSRRCRSRPATGAAPPPGGRRGTIARGESMQLRGRRPHRPPTPPRRG